MTVKLKKSLLTFKKNLTGKVSAFTPVKASITIEAAVAVPLIFFAIICFVYLFEILAIGTSIHSGLSYAAKEAVYREPVLPVISSERLEDDLVQAVGASRLERSIVVNGDEGIDCSSSRMSFLTGIGEAVAEYSIRIPVPVFGRIEIDQKESIRIKAWNGYEKSLAGIGNDQIVFLTETGLVYHEDYHCTYLDLSIQMVRSNDLEDMRNESGGRYLPCIRCGGGSGMVYITTNGDKYHSSISCSGLKRTVYPVPLSEVIGKGACVRCAR